MAFESLIIVSLFDLKIISCLYFSPLNFFKVLIREFFSSFNIITERHLKNKIDAYNCYKDEVRSGNHPRSIESLKTVAKYRGNSIGGKLYEAFAIVKNIKYEHKK